MDNFIEYKKDNNLSKVNSGKKIFEKQLSYLEGDNIIIDGVPLKALVINDDNIYNEKKEFRTVCMRCNEKCEHGSYVFYKGEYYIVVTDIDDHYYYKSCKMRKCNTNLIWELNGKIYNYPCLTTNDSYGVKVLSDNDYVRSQNIKLQILVQANNDTNMVIPDMRFIFNNSEFDIYSVVDINSSIIKGVLTFTCEKSVLQPQDDLKNNLAFNPILSNYKDNSKELVINGLDEINQEQDYLYTSNIEGEFYLDDFTSNNIAYIVEKDSTSCKIHTLKNNTSNYIVLKFKINGIVKYEKNIKVRK